MAKEQSLFQQKYNEFVSDLLGALPEYTNEIQVASALGDAERIDAFKEVAVAHGKEDNANPQKILPGVMVSDAVWASLSENTQKAIWEHLRLVSMCHMMETGFDAEAGATPSWMDDAMKDMKDKLDSDEFQSMMKKFMNIFGGKKDDEDAADAASAGAAKSGLPDFGSFFEKGMPKLPERFLNGHLVRLAQEIVKDIKPEDLGLDPTMLAECEKDPSRAFSMLFATFKNNPGVIQKVIAKVGNRIQQKIKSGAIRMEEIAREAEELIKEFADNPAFVEMMEGIKKAFGFEDMDMAKKAGKEGSARLSIVRDRLRKKLDKKKQQQQKL
jgi:hypothetical protein